MKEDQKSFNGLEAQLAGKYSIGAGRRVPNWVIPIKNP